jgi:DNA polymerase-3 subunit gamma/tau
MLSQAAFNAFLKTLEEPPSYAIFILATTEKHKVLPTILSRCQVFNFNRILVSDMVAHLQSIANQEGVKAETEALHLIAVKADGGLRDALSIFDQLVSFTSGDLTYAKSVEILNVLDADVYFRLCDCLLAEDRAGALLLFDDVLRRGFDGQFFVSGLSEHLRNLIVCREPKTEQLLEVADAFRPRFAEQARKADLSFFLNALNFTSEADQQYKASRNSRLLVELMLLKLCHLQSYVKQVPDIEALKKKFLSDAS